MSCFGCERRPLFPLSVQQYPTGGATAAATANKATCVALSRNATRGATLIGKEKEWGGKVWQAKHDQGSKREGRGKTAFPSPHQFPQLAT
jgi:hypothetical protein